MVEPLTAETSLDDRTTVFEGAILAVNGISMSVVGERKIDRKKRPPGRRWDFTTEILTRMDSNPEPRVGFLTSRVEVSSFASAATIAAEDASEQYSKWRRELENGRQEIST